jgi:hypothetical protein
MFAVVGQWPVDGGMDSAQLTHIVDIVGSKPGSNVAIGVRPLTVAMWRTPLSSSTLRPAPPTWPVASGPQYLQRPWTSSRS